MCQACIEAEIWAAYQAALAEGTEPAAADDKDAKVSPGPTPAPGPRAPECEIT